MPTFKCEVDGCIADKVIVGTSLINNLQHGRHFDFHHDHKGSYIIKGRVLPKKCNNNNNNSPE